MTGSKSLSNLNKICSLHEEGPIVNRATGVFKCRRYTQLNIMHSVHTSENKHS